MSDRIADVL